ncbi:hypothetical protein L249_2612 [Ophiocordyceps polyrhachis-furcata BCC 54312]|uniref:Uncharacterized protein n=1 Tax=Ophiocordyceps polyrhachis-furcata BCC 54312 TaxID=1330021 RepID=A0A367LSC1_9HYPO|nr:hypothetical protein L249_2612 [Ophiocordyceps polyrhachis-furcata BCC 54312]
MASKLGPEMIAKVKPRSVKDATRFTSTVPHATSKTASQAPPLPKTSSWKPGETAEQRVVRLRQAHLAAQRAQIKPMDRVIDSMRVFLDATHKLTINGIILFTVEEGEANGHSVDALGLAALVSIYSVWDMLRFNRARRAEWIQIQKRLESDELSAARIAYLKGEGTEAQIALVEEANREAERLGTKLPPLLPPPEQRTHFEETVKPVLVRRDQSKDGKGIFGIFSGIFGGSSSGDEAAAAAAAVVHDGPAPSDVGGTGTIVQAVEASAKGAWETEKERQRNGGSLDRLGLEDGDSDRLSSSGSRRWRPW